MFKLLPLLLLLPFIGCKSKDHPEPLLTVNSPTLVMLKVDYLTYRFEGLSVFRYPLGAGAADSIPIAISYRSPGDFGNLTLRYAPTGDTVFDGDIIWMGRGDLRYPAFDSTSGTVATAIPAPDSATVQGVYPDVYSTRFTDGVIRAAWTGIANLSVTHQLMSTNARKGLLLYTPSVGIGNPADWDYIWMLYLPSANN